MVVTGKQHPLQHHKNSPVPFVALRFGWQHFEAQEQGDENTQQSQCLDTADQVRQLI